MHGAGPFDALVAEAVAAGFASAFWPSRAAPRSVAYLRRRDRAYDVAVIRDPVTAVAYRAPSPPMGNPFAAQPVTWSAVGPAADVLRAVLRLPGPGGGPPTPDAVAEMPAQAVVLALPYYALWAARDAEKPTLTGEAIPLITTRKSDDPSTAASTGKV
ncbi:hypothetical protein KCV87_25950 [Actinosynnema pretiosum subsp. pretiosum]|uniref:Uncharacterized protein n=1 Tax=Actinosynnema pretiosum subsp. pretiosum TaxID=103721 RepID=A0AA45L3K4_9PSEU|nr:hypothetical protein APASM_5950 [Actinosynnema pretiosum subsp. pretiosum]QUF02859.1 hypothetical protein KCV87_25950 [Actinosynnema pretiosum subsp. pretiosum]